MASYYTTYTSNSVTFAVSGLEPGCYLRFFVRPDPATGSFVVDGNTTYAVASSSYVIQFGGLSPNTAYATNVYICVEDSPESDVTERLGTQYFTTLAAGSGWDWTKSNGLATDAQTQLAYRAITTQGELSDFSYLVWNDMVDKVSTIQSEKGMSWDSTFASLAATKMTATDKHMTAVRFNSLRYNIDLGYTTGLYMVYKGNSIYGDYFTKLTDGINGWVGE